MRLVIEAFAVLSKKLLYLQLLGSVQITIIKVISSKDSDLLSQFENIYDKGFPVADIPNQILDTSLQKLLINNHSDVNKCEVKGSFYLENFFGFCRSFQNVTKNLAFHLMFKTANLQDIIFTSSADIIKVTINNLYLYIPNVIPSIVMN